MPQVYEMPPGKQLDLLLKDGWTPALKASGFRKKRRVWWRTRDDTTLWVDVQSSQFNFRHNWQFTLNLGVAHTAVVTALAEPTPTNAVSCPWWVRVGTILPGGRDTWWKCQERTDRSALAGELVEVWDDYLQPWFDVVASQEGARTYLATRGNGLQQLALAAYELISGDRVAASGHALAVSSNGGIPGRRAKAFLDLHHLHDLGAVPTPMPDVPPTGGESVFPRDTTPPPPPPATVVVDETTETRWKSTLRDARSGDDLDAIFALHDLEAELGRVDDADSLARLALWSLRTSTSDHDRERRLMTGLLERLGWLEALPFLKELEGTHITRLTDALTAQASGTCSCALYRVGDGEPGPTMKEESRSMSLEDGVTTTSGECTRCGEPWTRDFNGRTFEVSWR